MFCPDPDTSRPDLLASTGDHLRVWRVGEEGVALDRLLSNVRGCGRASGGPFWSGLVYFNGRTKMACHCSSTAHAAGRAKTDLEAWAVRQNATAPKTRPQNKNSEFCAPLTSFDWNDHDPKRLGTSSIDTTVTIWDIEVGWAGLGLGWAALVFGINWVGGGLVCSSLQSYGCYWVVLVGSSAC
jgi:WD repeat-containing protein 68